MTKLAVNREGDRVIVNSGLEQRKQSRVWLIRGEMALAGQSGS